MADLVKMTVFYWGTQCALVIWHVLAKVILVFLMQISYCSQYTYCRDGTNRVIGCFSVQSPSHSNLLVYTCQSSDMLSEKNTVKVH